MKTLKFIFGLAALAVCFSFASCSDDNDDTKQAKPTVVSSFTGYLAVSDQGQTSAYAGDAAQVTLLQTGVQYSVNFNDAQYGTGTFDKVTYNGTNIEGSGTITVPASLASRATAADSVSFNATISGTLNDIRISIPTLNGGTTLVVRHGDASTAIGNLYEGLYEGKDTMVFAMMDGVKPYNADTTPFDTINVVYTGSNLVSATFKSTLTHTMFGPAFRAYVYGELTHINISEDGDSIKFSNVQADGSKPDSIQAAMNTPLLPSTKHYGAVFTGAVSKRTRLGVFHVSTEFGAMGAVHFTSTVKQFTAKL